MRLTALGLIALMALQRMTPSCDARVLRVWSLVVVVVECGELVRDKKKEKKEGEKKKGRTGERTNRAMRQRKKKKKKNNCQRTVGTQETCEQKKSESLMVFGGVSTYL